MKKTRKAGTMWSGLALGTIAVASFSAYFTTKCLVDAAFNREPPRLMKHFGRFIAGSRTDPELDRLREERAQALSALAHETVRITAHDGETLVGHFFPCPEQKRLIIAFHGWRSTWFRDFVLCDRFFRESGCSILYAEQRGQNSSGGSHMGFGLIERFDCADWVRWGTAHSGEGLPIYLAGISMGATTVLMAAGTPLPSAVHGIIADCGFTSPHAIFRHIAHNNLHLFYGLRSQIADLLCRRKLSLGTSAYSTVEALRHNSQIPVLFIHGSDDRFVPVWMTYENYRACAAPKELLIVPGADHGISFFVEPERYQAAVRDFWQKYD